MYVYMYIYMYMYMYISRSSHWYTTDIAQTVVYKQKSTELVLYLPSIVMMNLVSKEGNSAFKFFRCSMTLHPLEISFITKSDVHLLRIVYTQSV